MYLKLWRSISLHHRYPCVIRLTQINDLVSFTYLEAHSASIRSEISILSSQERLLIIWITYYDRVGPTWRLIQEYYR